MWRAELFAAIPVLVSGRRESAHVKEHGEDVGSLPMLDDPAVAESHMVDPADANGLAGGSLPGTGRGAYLNPRAGTRPCHLPR